MTASTVQAISELFDIYLESTNDQAKNKAFNELWTLLSSNLHAATNPALIVNQIKLLHSTIIDYQLNVQKENERANARRKNDLLVYLFDSLSKLPAVNHANPLFVEIKSYLTAVHDKSSSINSRISSISRDTLAHSTLTKSASGNVSKRPLPEDSTLLPTRTKSAKSSIVDFEELATPKPMNSVQFASNQSTVKIVNSVNLTPPASPNVSHADTVSKAVASKIRPAILPKPTFLPIKDATEFQSELANYLSVMNQKERQKLLTRLGAYVTNLMNDQSLDKAIKIKEIEQAINSFAFKHIESQGFDSNLENFILSQREKLAVKTTSSLAKPAVNTTVSDDTAPNNLSSMAAQHLIKAKISVSNDQQATNLLNTGTTVEVKDAVNIAATKSSNLTKLSSINTSSKVKPKTGQLNRFQTSINSTKTSSSSPEAYQANLKYAIKQARNSLNVQCQLLEKEKSGFCLFASRKTAKIEALRQFAKDLANLNLIERDLCQTINNQITTLRKNHPKLDAGFFSNRTGELIDNLGAYLRSVIVNNEKIDLGVFTAAQQNGDISLKFPL